MVAPGSEILPNQITIARLHQLPESAVPLAGGKAASLSRMTRFGLPVPPGFAVCTDVFDRFLHQFDGANVIDRVTSGLDVHDARALAEAARALQDLILGRALPDEIAAAIDQAYRELSEAEGPDSRVAVRSSAASEDGDAASFAGQQETFLNVRGADTVRRKVQECWASFFSPRALFYRAEKGRLEDTGMAVVVQSMVFPEKSGVLFTIDPIQHREDYLVIEAVFGIGEGIVSGCLTPDHYVVRRVDGSVAEEFVAIQTEAIVDDPVNGGVRHIEIPEEQGSQPVLDQRELAELWQMGLRVEQFFGKPQDIEWAIRGGRLFLLQSRPVTTGGKKH